MNLSPLGSALVLLLASGVACGRVTLEEPDGFAGAGAGGAAGIAGGVGGSGVGGSGVGGSGVGGSGVGGSSACDGLPEAACLGNPAICRADYCPTCSGVAFARCARWNDPKPLCIAPPCVPLLCSDATTLEACEQRTDCHSVFRDASLVCDCATVGCSCVAFIGCADGDRAQCQAQSVSCDVAPPYCGASYAISYTSRCYEGCVALKDCRVPPGGPPPP